MEIYILHTCRLVAHDTTGYCIISEANNTCYVSVILTISPEASTKLNVLAKARWRNAQVHPNLGAWPQKTPKNSGQTAFQGLKGSAELLTTDGVITGAGFPLCRVASPTPFLFKWRMRMICPLSANFVTCNVPCLRLVPFTGRWTGRAAQNSGSRLHGFGV